MEFENNASALKHSTFVESEIENLLESGRILEVSDPPTVINPLSVTDNPDGSQRLILDLSIVNDFILKDSIKFEDWRVMEEYVSQGDYLWKFDIQKGYHHIDVWEGHQTFLGFAWHYKGHRRYFFF